MSTEQATAGAPLSLDNLRNGPPTISVLEAAPYLGVSRRHIYEMARSGRLPVIKIGQRHYRVSTAALIRMLESGTADSGAA